MNQRAWIIAATLWMGLVVGCGAQPGKTMMTLSRGGNPPPLQSVSQSGDFAVYPNNSVNPIVRYELDRNDRYGFVKNPGGDVVAVVEKGGQQTQIPLPGGLATAYYWKKSETK